jgi:hypothetical protein
MLLTKHITIILLYLRFSEILAADENRQVFEYLVRASFEITEVHVSSQYQDGYEPPREEWEVFRKIKDNFSS